MIKKAFKSKIQLCSITAVIVIVIIIIITFSLNGIKRPANDLVQVEFEAESNKQEPDKIPSLLKPLEKDFQRKIFNLNFQYVLQANQCQSNTLAVIIVTSHFNNVETRSAMRRSYSGQDLQVLNVRRVFLLGQAPDSRYMKQKAVLDESRRFGDIVQGNFMEAYRNLTYKHVMGLKWVSEYCNPAQYVIKMDDDIVVNMEKTIHFLTNASFPKNVIAGYVLRHMVPIREPANKWFVTKEEYHYSQYPSFVSGWFYITTPSIFGKLFLMSHYFDYFWIDDVYVTGILTNYLRIKLYDLKNYFTVYPEFLQCCISDVKKRLDCEILVGPNGGNSNLFYEFNEAMKICGISKCDRRVKLINETCVAERQFSLGRGNAVIENYNLH